MEAGDQRPGKRSKASRVGGTPGLKRAFDLYRLQAVFIGALLEADVFSLGQEKTRARTEARIWLSRANASMTFARPSVWPYTSKS